MRKSIAIILGLLTVESYAKVTTASESHNDEVTLNIMSGAHQDNIVSIYWPSVEPINPFSDQPLLYEIWHNDALLDTVSHTRYDIKISDLSEKLGCISIRAVRGNTKSSYSAPACFFISGISG